MLYSNTTTETILTIPATPGSYLLLFQLSEAIEEFSVGKLGVFSLPPGSWIYCGSAWGSGGLSSRLRRHLRTDKKLHWHIDFLSSRLPVSSILAVPQAGPSLRLECLWTQHLLASPGFSAPLPHFGSSDCRACPAHLIHSEQMITIEELEPLLMLNHR